MWTKHYYITSKHVLENLALWFRIKYKIWNWYKISRLAPGSVGFLSLNAVCFMLHQPQCLLMKWIWNVEQYDVNLSSCHWLVVVQGVHWPRYGLQLPPLPDCRPLAPPESGPSRLWPPHRPSPSRDHPEQGQGQAGRAAALWVEVNNIKSLC